MSLTLIDPPSAEPITLSELKEYLKIDHADEDAVLSGLLLAARRTVEARGGLALLPQTWRLALDKTPASPIILPLSPVLSVDSVGAVRNGVAETLPAASYEAQAGARGRVRIKTPVAADVELGGVIIVFTAGFADAASVPAELKQAIKVAAAHLYERREGEGPAPALAPYVAAYRQVRL